MRNQDSGPAPIILAQSGTPEAPATPATPATPAEPVAPDLGFKLPGVGGATPPPRGTAPPASEKNGAPQFEVQPGPVAPLIDTSARDLVLGAGVFLVLMVVFFFARNAFTQHLVVRRVAPSKAGSAGWLPRAWRRAARCSP